MNRGSNLVRRDAGKFSQHAGSHSSRLVPSEVVSDATKPSKADVPPEDDAPIVPVDTDDECEEMDDEDTEELSEDKEALIEAIVHDCAMAYLREFGEAIIALQTNKFLVKREKAQQKEKPKASAKQKKEGPASKKRKLNK